MATRTDSAPPSARQVAVPRVAERPPRVAPTQEIRFGVVMFGGVSLAIYINGVARELFRMVRATAPAERGGEWAAAGAGGTEAVYRKLGQLMEGGHLNVAACEIDAGGRVRLRDEAAPIRTRFVVDILSGTSAGGLNAIYLAKALVRDGDFDVLRDLWLREAEIGRLIHDVVSRGRGWRTPWPAASLLNGNRMYAKLLEALDALEGSGAARSRLVEELDLAVTATDIAGLPVQMVLDGVQVTERRHRNVFRFRYVTPRAGGGEGTDDFLPENDAFLAFAARCTSAFPAAFEPVRLNDLRQAPRPPRDLDPRWRSFYRDYAEGDFADRYFHDGGTLDNKPFTYAADALAHRRSDVPVNRKLVYIEPSPELAPPAAGGEGGASGQAAPPAPAPRPYAVRNAVAALFSLPRQEPVREDLERLLERNRQVRRVSEILRDRERDVLRRDGSQAHAKLPGTAWAEADLGVMLDRFGLAYGAYHRLRLATVLDHLALLLARLLGHAPESAEQLGLRRLLSHWRATRYAAYRSGPDDPRPSENAFLFRFDLSWWLRRLSFVEEKNGELLCAAAPLEASYAQVLAAHPRPAELAGRLAAAGVEEVERELFRIRHVLNDAYVYLRAAGRALRSRAEGNEFRAVVDDLAVTGEELRALAALPEQRCRERLDALVARDGEALDRLGEALADAIATAVQPAAHAVRFSLGLEPVLTPAAAALLAPEEPEAARALELRSDAPAAAAVREALALPWEEFARYDQISFPILQDVVTGEADEADVIRVSPLDAGALVPEPERRARKLIGTWLSNFGAFFRESWRRNDMTWGRLDGAERLVHSLLPDSRLSPEERRVRDALVRELHDAILEEEGVDRERFLERTATGRRPSLLLHVPASVLVRLGWVGGWVAAGVAFGRRRRGRRAGE